LVDNCAATNNEATMPKQKRTLETEPPVKRAKKAKLFADDLEWKEVAMPDRLDDVEGFFGLEEIEGVDVVADEAGKLEFQVWKTLLFGWEFALLIVVAGGPIQEEDEEDEVHTQARR
jgi:hypothetical protein